MARNFPRSTSDYISLGDIAAAKFEWNATWTVICHFRVADTATDDNCVICKSASGKRQFWCRVDLGAAPERLEVLAGNGNRILTANVVALDTWYCLAITNDGTGGAAGLACYLFEMDGTVQVDGDTGQHASDVGDNTAAILIGQRAGGPDEMDGDVAFASYFSVEFSRQDVVDYIRQPGRVAARNQPSTVFFLPLNGSSPEVDWSGNGNSGTVNGTPGVSDNPPVGPLFGYDVPRAAPAA